MLKRKAIYDAGDPMLKIPQMGKSSVAGNEADAYSTDAELGKLLLRLEIDASLVKQHSIPAKCWRMCSSMMPPLKTLMFNLPVQAALPSVLHGAGKTTTSAATLNCGAFTEPCPQR